MYVNFEYYRIFYQVALHCSFTRAAQALGSNQPNVTRAMNRLEAQTHCKLFLRSNRGVRLTPEGEELFRHVQAAMGQLEAAERELEAAVNLDEGTVSIGASETALHVFLLKTLETFCLRWPNIRLRLANHSTPQAVRAVQEGKVDLAVVTTPIDLPRGLRAEPLAQFGEVFVGGRAFAALREHVFALEELKNYPLIALGPETMTYEFYRALFAEHGLPFAPDTEAATADQLLPLAEHGLGLAFVPEPLARPALERGQVVAFALKQPIPPRQVCLVYDPLRPMGAAARRLKERILADSQLPEPPAGAQ